MADQYVTPRRWARLSVVVECRIEGLSGHAPARLTELSIGGGYVDTNAPFAVGNPVRFVIVIDGTDVPVSARVIYTHTGIGFGFTFEPDMDPDAYQRVTEYLSRNGS